MVWWLIGVAACVAIWGAMWRGNQPMAFGVLLGLLLAWLASRFLTPYMMMSDMENFPIWLPPLPMATVALLLFVYGAIVWFRGNAALPQPKKDEHDKHGH